MAITNYDGLAFEAGLYVGKNGSEQLIINSSGTFVFPISLTGNVIIGSASTDTLTVNATSTFATAATFQGQILANSGSLTLPGVAFRTSGSGNTGLYLSAADQLSIVTNGTERANVSSSGVWTFTSADWNVTTTATSFNRLQSTGTSTQSVQLRLQTAAATTGDPYITLLSGIDNWSIGSDTSDSATLKFDNGTTVGSNTRGSITASGVWTLGPASSTLTHAMNGSLTITDSSDALLQITSSASNKEAAIDVQLASGNTTSDAYTTYRIAAGTSWALGLDNSDSDTFKISQSTGLGTNDFLTVSTAGIVTIGTGTATTHALNTVVATGASAGADTLPANPVGFIAITINGTARKIPYYAT